MLLAAGADVCGPSRTYLTPLLVAIKQRDKKLIQQLLRASATINSTYYIFHNGEYVSASVLPAAVAWGDHPLILEIINAGADIHLCKARNSALKPAILKNNTAIAQTPLSRGADPDE